MKDNYKYSFQVGLFYIFSIYKCIIYICIIFSQGLREYDFFMFIYNIFIFYMIYCLLVYMYF